MVPRPTIGLAIEPDDRAGSQAAIGAGDTGRPLAPAKGPGPGGPVRPRVAAAPCRRASRASAARRQIALGEVLFGRARGFRLRSRGFFASNRDQMQGLHPDPGAIRSRATKSRHRTQIRVEYGRERPNPGAARWSNTGTNPMSRVKLRRGHSPTGTTGSTTVILVGRSDADLAAPVPAPAPRANSG